MTRNFSARDINGNVKCWSVEVTDSHHIITRWGSIENPFANSKVINVISKNQFNSMVRDKLKLGYVETPQFNNIEAILRHNNVTAEGFIIPMKCQSYKDNHHKLDDNLMDQPKINGVRASILWSVRVIGEGVFAKVEERAIALSKKGNEYVMPHITNCFTKDMFSNDEVYDGEFYIPGKKLNEIKASIPMVNFKGTLSQTSGNPLEVQFWMFDLAIENVGQLERLQTLYRICGSHQDSIAFSNQNQHVLHYKGGKPIVLVDYQNIVKDDCVKYAQYHVANGYEGAIFRTYHSEYAFGQRPSTIQKLKFSEDTECNIIDVIPKPLEPETAIFVLRNDINSETFECNPVGSYELRKRYLDDKVNLIGKFATVKFFERSGVKNVPFHANVIVIRDYE